MVLLTWRHAAKETWFVKSNHEPSLSRLFGSLARADTRVGGHLDRGSNTFRSRGKLEHKFMQDFVLNGGLAEARMWSFLRICALTTSDIFPLDLLPAKSRWSDQYGRYKVRPANLRGRFKAGRPRRTFAEIYSEDFISSLRSADWPGIPSTED